MKITSTILKPFVSIAQNHEKKRYRKYISSFSRPENAEFINELDVINYDLVENDALAGHCTKYFVMIDKSKLEKYFWKIKKGNSCYESYLDNQDILSGQIPQNISILLKKEHPYDVTIETFGSNVLNFFGIKTCYNFPIKDKNGKLILGSVDFIKPNEEFFTYAQYSNGQPFDNTDSLLHINYSAKISIDEFSKQHLLFLSKKEKDKLLEEVLYAGIVRKLVLGDHDFRAGNFGLLYNKKTRTVRNSPNFDFDYLFRGYPNHEQELRWLSENRPEIYNKFKKKFSEYSTKHIYLDYIRALKKEQAKKLLNQIEAKINQTTMTINTIEKEKSQQQEK